MPANRLSLNLTTAYRQRLDLARDRLQRLAEERWPSLDDFDGSDWPRRMAGLVAQAQTEAIRASAGYLGTYLTLELGKRSSAPAIDSRTFAGKSRDGRPLAESLESPIIGVRTALKQAYAVPGQMVDVSPADARKWLAGGTHGGLQQSEVDALAEKMKAGTWDPKLGVIRITGDGFVFDGQHRLRAVVQSGLTVKMEVARGVPDPIRYGLDRAKRQVGVDFDAAHRQALLGAIDADDRFDGWQRALRGTCGACAAVASHVEHGIHFAVHPGCHCVSEPVVKGVPNLFPRATGAELFAAKSDEELDEAVGPLAATLLREGRIQLSELVQHEELDSDQAGFITQKPAEQLLTT